MKLYYHKTDGGAEYLYDTYIQCKNGHKEGSITSETKYIIRIDGDITKDAELNIIKIDGETEANAKRIVTCVNSHDRLIIALKDLVKSYEFKMGKSAIQLRIEIAKDAIKQASKSV